MSEAFDNFVTRFVEYNIFEQYATIGGILYFLLMCSVFIGLGRSVIEFATVEKPSMTHITVAPGLTLQDFVGEYTHELQPWFAQLCGNLLIFVVGGAVGCIIGWGAIPFILLQRSITASRKKRFG